MLPQLIQSMKIKNPDKFKTVENEAVYRSFLSKSLAQKPDIYFLFIESYGTVATLSPELESTYKNLITSLQKPLNDEGWHMASTYSIAPIKGGRSWLSFSSTLSGIKIENQLQYNNMIELNKNFPHLVRYLNYQGYQTYRMSTMSNTNTDSLIPLNKNNQFWGFDDLIMYNDIPYKGYQYDYLGGLPDQYALGHFDENIGDKSTSPKFLFFITTTSHGPWYPPPPIVKDWKALDDLKESPTGESPQLKGETIFRYQKSIEYELKVVIDFIKKSVKSQ